MRRDEITADVRRYNLEHHRTQPRNIGFRWSDGRGHTVKLWLSCDYDLAVEYKRTMPLFLDLPVSFPSGVGMFWALIVDASGKAIYFATPRNRSKNYKENVLWNAYITRKRVEHWPPCEKCKARGGNVEMEIEETKTHANRWACFKTANHDDGEPAFKDWNFCLTPEEKKVKNEEYRRRAKVRRARTKQAEEQGKPAPRKAHDVRIPWRGRHRHQPPAA